MLQSHTQNPVYDIKVQKNSATHKGGKVKTAECRYIRHIRIPHSFFTLPYHYQYLPVLIAKFLLILLFLMIEAVKLSQQAIS